MSWMKETIACGTPLMVSSQEYNPAAAMMMKICAHTYAVRTAASHSPRQSRSR